MLDLDSLKYAELRKLAKQAGVKANQKVPIAPFVNTKETDKSAQSGHTIIHVHEYSVTKGPLGCHVYQMKPPYNRSSVKTQEKLIAALRKYYEDKESAAKSKPTTPKTPITVKGNSKPATPAEKKATPVQHAKQTAVTKQSVQSKFLTPGKVVSGTPKVAAKGTPNSAHKVAIRKVVTPLRTKVLTPVRPKVATPVRPKVASTGKPKSEAPSSVTLVTKVSTPKQPAGTTPGSKKGTPRWEKKVFTSAKQDTPKQVTSPVSGKRKSTGTPKGSAAKKRRSTFEKAPTPDIHTPVIDGRISAGKRRSGRTSSSGVKDILGAMKPEMSAAEMKDSLMSAIDKKVLEKVKNAPPSASNIPRFAAFLKQRQEAKPVTPGNKNWEKIHKKNFEKFDSIDVYLEKKRKRADEITASVKKARNLLEEVHHAVDKLKSHKTPQGIENKKPRFSNANRTTPFKPTILSTSSMNLNFGAVKSPKTLPRKSPKPVFSIPKTDKFVAKKRKSVGSSIANKSINTPFKFTALNVTVESTHKTKFDLKASLARPITWKTHKGKLKPLAQEGSAYTKTVSAAKAKKERHETRKNVADRRADKKDKARMARRGIKM